MKRELQTFLKEQEGNVVWLATSAGIFQGKIPYTYGETIKLEGAFYFTGDIRLTIGEVTIITENIVAWGTSNPGFQNKFE